jgi:glycosyltransferase involved in cell wall biosynthesis
VAQATGRAMSTLLFYDPLCLQPYDSDSLRERALGGTEATLVRIADALGAWVMQHNRRADRGRYLRPQSLSGITAVVVNRDARALPFVLRHFPQARVYLWLHDRMRPGSRRARGLRAGAALLGSRPLTAVCVSNWQRAQVELTLATLAQPSVAAVTIYNPVDDALQPDGTPVDARKLVFFSSPNKGLDFTLDVFAAVRRAQPELRLLVANPGYKADRRVKRPGVEFLGALPQTRVHEEVRSALCTFAPNFVIPETFGLVFAESHALGTPVLTHDCGAALEVVGDPQQVLALRPAYRLYESLVRLLPRDWRSGPARLAAAGGLFEAYGERLHQWRTGARPQAVPDARFRLSAITAQWRALLEA